MPNDNVLTDEQIESMAIAHGLYGVRKAVVLCFRALLAAHPGQPEPRAEVTLTANDADMVWRDDDGEMFYHSIDDAVDYEVDQAWPTTGPLELKVSLAKKIPTATVRIFNITENGYEWEIVDAARTGASS
ncbi:hypothetical protein NYD60_03105 [Burkholderia thailandensis]|uniref:hypothetical protein n=1 Tax=Burkholderia thailandensis TaxID=57975 RepID=UPI00217E3A4A|nr:hypothetical protein [Burkholderia thailandensis]MCS6498996.1 hypothetical protein [Burkholderia thailandensis]